MDKKTKETFEKLFADNKEWERVFYNSPGTDNPFPGKICYKFMDYYFKHYELRISYKLPWKKKRIEFSVGKTTAWDAIYHAVFDCQTFDECIDTLEHWVKNYYEEWIYNDDDPEFTELWEAYCDNDDYDIKIKAKSVLKR